MLCGPWGCSSLCCDKRADGVSVGAVGGPVVEDDVQFAPNFKLVRSVITVSPHVRLQAPVNTEASDGTSDYSQ